MSCPFAGLATRYTVKDERVSVRICVAVPYERDSDPEDLPLPSVCFSQGAWQSCAHYLRLTQRREVARRLGLPPADGEAPPAADAPPTAPPPPPAIEARTPLVPAILPGGGAR